MIPPCAHRYPTFGESYGYVVAEALAMELPVVATAVGSIPELVRPGINGFLVQPIFERPNVQVPFLCRC
jgi:glycosyltransferase involved in cell wall biosynthesis